MTSPASSPVAPAGQSSGTLDAVVAQYSAAVAAERLRGNVFLATTVAFGLTAIWKHYTRVPRAQLYGYRGYAAPTPRYALPAPREVYDVDAYEAPRAARPRVRVPALGTRRP